MEYKTYLFVSTDSARVIDINGVLVEIKIYRDTNKKIDISVKINSSVITFNDGMNESIVTDDYGYFTFVLNNNNSIFNLFSSEIKKHIFNEIVKMYKSLD